MNGLFEQMAYEEKSDKLQFDGASPPNPLPDRGGGTIYLCLLRF